MAADQHHPDKLDARQQALITDSDLSGAPLLRVRGWAMLVGVMVLDTGMIDYPRNIGIGERTLQHVAVSSRLRESNPMKERER